MLQPQRSDRQHRNPLLVDEERILVGAVDRSAVLDDSQPAGGELLADAMVQHDHAVGDVFFQAVPGHVAVAPLGGDDGRDALILEPAEEAAEFGPQDARIAQAAKERFDGVQDHALRPDRVDRTPQPDEKPFEVVFARLLDLAPLDAHVVDRQFLPATIASRSKPSERTFCVSSSAVSSKAMKTPGSSNSVAPRTRNSMPSNVLPQPALPQTKVGLPCGRPPPVISSSP